MFELIDEYCWEKHKKVLTFDYHQLKGLKNFCHWNLNHAVSPTPMHYHSQIIEFHCLVKGERLCKLQNSPSCTIYGNEVFITFPSEVHSIGTHSQHPAEFYGFQIDLSDPDHLLGLDKTFSNALYILLTTITIRHLKVEAHHLSLFKKAFELFASKKQSSIYLGTQYLCCFLFDLPNLKPVHHKLQSPLDECIQKALNYIEENYDSPIYLSKLSEISCLSLSCFKSKFKKTVGITPTEYINLKKIEHAKQLLENTDIPITELAFSLGFSSSNYFCTVFKKYLAISPSQYRQKFYPSLIFPDKNRFTS